MTSPHHWVQDLDAAMKRWRQDLGTGSFEVIEHVTFEEFVLTTPDGQQHHDVTFDHAAAFAAWGPLVVELNRVHAIDDRLAAALNPTPGAVSHVPWVLTTRSTPPKASAAAAVAAATAPTPPGRRSARRSRSPGAGGPHAAR